MIKVLWITNIMLPPICEAINRKPRPVGGWMFSSLQKLMHIGGLKLAVATTYDGNQFRHQDINGVRYYLLPQKASMKTYYDSSLENYWMRICQEFKPVVVHVHGSEYPLGLSWVKANSNKGVVCSIQGLVSVYSRYYLGGISYKEAKVSSLRDSLLCNGLFAQQRDFVRRGGLEKSFIQSINHIIGRTDWDKSHIWAINPNATYYYCGETLRETFYRNTWSYKKCQPYLIFTSQAGYAIKGFHKLLMALPLILRNFPKAHICLTGTSPFYKPVHKLGSYELYLKRLMSELEIKDKIIFLGSLDAEQMCEQFLRCNVFVCPSAIENSPNSLGEAQILGVPHVASFVGGIPEIVEYDETILYRFDEHEMLAKKINDIFKLKDSFKPKTFDKNRYDGDYNVSLLMGIYQKIAQTNA